MPDADPSQSRAALLGVAILLPRDVDAASRQAVLRALGRWERSGLRLLLGRAGAAKLVRATAGDRPAALDPTTWSGPSRRWTSVTPVALDRNPGPVCSERMRGYNVSIGGRMKAKLIRIGNSRGVRLPKPVIEEAGLADDVEVRVRDGAVIISSRRPPRSGWAEAARHLAERGEDRLLDEPTCTQFDQGEWRWR